MTTDLQSDFTFEMARVDLPLAEPGQGEQEYEYGLPASAFSFSNGCLTPPDSNSAISSRRPSETFFDPTNPESGFPGNSHTLSRSSARLEGPPAFGHNSFEPFVLGQEHVFGSFYDDFGFDDPNPSSPQTVLPAQTMVYPSNSLSGLAQDNETLSLYEYRTTSPDTHKIDSYYQSDRKVLAVVVKPSISAQKSKRKRSSSERDFDQWGSTSSYEIKTLKAECTTVESHKSKKYLCEICPQGFDRQEHWKRHEKSATHREKLKMMDEARLGPDPPMYYCRVCGKGLNRHDNVKPHEESHLPSRGKTRRHTPIPVERSLELGMGDMDPRINPDLKKKPRKKARLH